ncbi:glycosylphosphatidylinositol anchor biosynthesis [Coniosporium apollinis]|uniref:Glycosylphosphatidylinositol anchor biosynthesis n=1 Tax=Coniosporium apollinis TaxID=61459 RepID=A0ABQ9NQA7_9PEZI|nr:glycosylphosphatidylinositol anchor biosynthesis [Coniosporium apollinis]
MPPYEVSSSASTSVAYSPPLSQPLPHHRLADPLRLDSFITPYSSPRRPRDSSTSLNALRLQDASNSLHPPSAHRTRKPRIRSSSRRRKPPVWRKLLWVKQSYPDNYTDAATFLDHLQRNPRLQPYEFWQLVGEATVIVQHVAAVAVFACCFVGIYAERVSPVTVVGAGSVGTVVGWVIWDGWIGKEEEAAAAAAAGEAAAKKSIGVDAGGGDAAEDGSSTSSGNGELGPNTAGAAPRQTLSHSASATSVNSLANGIGPPTGAPTFAAYSYHPPYGDPVSSFSPRNQQRLATAKSAVLIYCALLGLSPILKSLTKSTTSDSIWAMSCWLMCINVFFFDYGGSVGAKYVTQFRHVKPSHFLKSEHRFIRGLDC